MTNSDVPTLDDLRTDLDVTGGRMLRCLISDSLDTGVQQVLEVLAVGDARCTNLSSDVVGGIVTSPPYFTRLDYAVATTVELALLARVFSIDVQGLRRSLTGGTARRLEGERITLTPCVERLVAAITAHPSYGSSSYYGPLARTYFSDLTIWMSECSRLLQRHARMCVVVQDSWYKDIHVNLPDLMIMLGKDHGLIGRVLAEFPVGNSYAVIHQHVRKWNGISRRTEFVLGFTRE